MKGFPCRIRGAARTQDLLLNEKKTLKIINWIHNSFPIQAERNSDASWHHDEVKLYYLYAHYPRHP